MKCWVTCDNNCKILECQTNSDEQQCILKKYAKNSVLRVSRQNHFYVTFFKINDLNLVPPPVFHKNAGGEFALQGCSVAAPVRCSWQGTDRSLVATARAVEIS